ncbi:MAG TPA: SH3 domain-containing protein [Rhizomicrobium sp.]|nr:SH3 domain-containing protein [Rhizomicrobium sp.]
MWRIVLGLLAAAFLGSAARAEGSGDIPRYASFDNAKVYLREGPSYSHAILWVYHRKGLPVKVVAQYDVWRRIEDAEGSLGWVHSSMLSDVRTVIVTAKKPAAIREDDDSSSKILALAQPGVIAKLEACRAMACEIATDGIDGWIDKKNIWGVNTSESFR